MNAKLVLAACSVVLLVCLLWSPYGTKTTLIWGVQEISEGNKETNAGEADSTQADLEEVEENDLVTNEEAESTQKGLANTFDLGTYWANAIPSDRMKVIHVSRDIFDKAETIEDLVEMIQDAVSPWKHDSAVPYMKFIGQGTSVRWNARLMRRDNFKCAEHAGKDWRGTTSPQYWGYKCSFYNTESECMSTKAKVPRKPDVTASWARSPRVIYPFQKFDRVPFLRSVLWDKGQLCNTLKDAIGDREKYFNYTFRCWSLPRDKDELATYASTQSSEAKFIVKPMGGSLGNGISVVPRAKLEKKTLRGKRKMIVQTYMNDPYIINSHKWDARLYVNFASSYPLRAYVYPRGLARFAGVKYNADAKGGGAKHMFLTNTHGVAQNKLSTRTWSFKQLEEHMNTEQAGLFDHVWEGITKAVSLVLLSAEQRFYTLTKADSKIPQGTQFYQLLGIDVIVGANGNAKVIEVNGRPSSSLQSGRFTDHYSKTKGLRAQDQFRMMYTRVDIKDELVRYLKELRPDGYVDDLTSNEWVYLVKYLQERQNMGRYKMVYPHKDLDEFHWEFMKDFKSTGKAREALHKVLMYIETNYPPPPPDLEHDLVDSSNNN